MSLPIPRRPAPSLPSTSTATIWQAGDVGVVCSFGAGYSVGSVVVKKALTPTMHPRCDETPQCAAAGPLPGRGRASWICGAPLPRTRALRAFQPAGAHVFADLSKNLWDRQAWRLLLDMARACRLEHSRDAMFAGQAVNSTEAAPLHAPRCAAPGLACPVTSPCRPGPRRRCTPRWTPCWPLPRPCAPTRQITDIVNIGIGGSDLGRTWRCGALAGFPVAGPSAFISSPTSTAMSLAVLPACGPRARCSSSPKTFTTLETMANARSALDWFAAQGRW